MSKNKFTMLISTCIKMRELIYVLKVKKLHKVQIKINMTNLSITSIPINDSFLISLISGYGKL